MGICMRKYESSGTFSKSHRRLRGHPLRHTAVLGFDPLSKSQLARALQLASPETRRLISIWLETWTRRPPFKGPAQ